MSRKNLVYSRDLRKLVGRYPGFEVVIHGSGIAVAAANNEKLPLRGSGTHINQTQLKNIEAWMKKRATAAQTASRTQAHYRDNDERGNVGWEGMASARRGDSQKRMERMKVLWAKLLPDDQERFARELVRELSERDGKWLEARRQIGV